MVAQRDLDDHRHQGTLRETGPSEFDVEGSLEVAGIEQAILKGDSRLVSRERTAVCRADSGESGN